VGSVSFWLSLSGLKASAPFDLSSFGKSGLSAAHAFLDDQGKPDAPLMELLYVTLQQYPELALFITLAINVGCQHAPDTCGVMIVLLLQRACELLWND
jgi:hypothetical protein